MMTAPLFALHALQPVCVKIRLFAMTRRTRRVADLASMVRYRPCDGFRVESCTTQLNFRTGRYERPAQYAARYQVLVTISEIVRP